MSEQTTYELALAMCSHWVGASEPCSPPCWTDEPEVTS